MKDRRARDKVALDIVPIHVNGSVGEVEINSVAVLGRLKHVACVDGCIRERYGCARIGDYIKAAYALGNGECGNIDSRIKPRAVLYRSDRLGDASVARYGSRRGVAVLNEEISVRRYIILGIYYVGKIGEWLGLVIAACDIIVKAVDVIRAVIGSIVVRCGVRNIVGIAILGFSRSENHET